MQKGLDLRRRFDGCMVPQEKELELDVISLCLNGKADDVFEYIKDSSTFHTTVLEKVFDIFLKLADKGTEITPLAVFRESGDKDLARECTVYKDRKVNERNLVSICLTLLEVDIARKLILKCSEIMEVVYNDTTQSIGMVSSLTEFGEDITASLSQLKQNSFQKTKESVLKEIEERVNNPEAVVVNSGITDFDKAFGGFEKGTVTIFGARPGAGKTALMVQLAYNVAIRMNKKVLFFNLEMTKEELCKRLLALHTMFSNFEIKRGFDGDKEKFKTFKTLAETLTTENIIIIDDVYDSREINQKTKRLVKSHGVELMILDYMQLSSLKDSGNREQEISKISRGLKRLSKDAQIPVVSLSQLSRAVETRGGDKRPQLSDIRESGAIEQDADGVVFLYRPEYYGVEEKEGGGSTKDLLELIIAKARNGITVTVDVKYQTRYNKVGSFSGVDYLYPTKMQGDISSFEKEVNF
jgi:replicative DNA helicase